jgi:hypothetical protein
MSIFPENMYPYYAMPPVRTMRQMHFFYLCCTVSFCHYDLDDFLGAYAYFCFYWEYVVGLTNRDQIRRISRECTHPFHEVGRFYFKHFRLVDPFPAIGYCPDTDIGYSPDTDYRNRFKTMPLVSLRRVNTLKEVFRCYKKTLDCNVAEWVAFNHELYKPGGVEMLKLVDKYSFKRIE